MRVKKAFTLVEIGVVIVILGLLFVVSYIGYSEVQKNAIKTGMQSDLTKAYEQLDVFQVQKGNYPATVDCSTPDSNTNLCLKSGKGITFSYQYNNSVSPKGYCLTATDGTNYYHIKGSTSSTGSPSFSQGVCNACAAVPSGLQLCLDAGSSISYPGSGTKWYDISGKGNIGNLVNGPTYSSDNGGSIVFDGVNDYFDMTPLAFSVAGVTNYSASMWINLNQSTLGTDVRFFWHGNYGALIYKNTSNELLFYLRTDTTKQIVTPFASLLNTWVNVSATYDGVTMKLYVNSELKSSSSKTVGIINDNPTRFWLGGTNASFFAASKISSTMVYDRALTQEEVTKSFATTRSRYGI